MLVQFIWSSLNDQPVGWSSISVPHLRSNCGWKLFHQYLLLDPWLSTRSIKCPLWRRAETDLKNSFWNAAFVFVLLVSGSEFRAALPFVLSLFLAWAKRKLNISFIYKNLRVYHTEFASLLHGISFPLTHILQKAILFSWYVGDFEKLCGNY